MTYLLQTASLSCIQQILLGRLAYEKTEFSLSFILSHSAGKWYEAFNPLWMNDAYMQHEIWKFSTMMSYLATSLGDWLCMNRQCSKGGGGWANPEGANSMAVSVVKSPWLELIGLFSCFKHNWTLLSSCITSNSNVKPDIPARVSIARAPWSTC